MVPGFIQMGGMSIRTVVDSDESMPRWRLSAAARSEQNFRLERLLWARSAQFVRGDKRQEIERRWIVKLSIECFPLR
jgi:hypothetical protein